LYRRVDATDDRRAIQLLLGSEGKAHRAEAKKDEAPGGRVSKSRTAYHRRRIFHLIVGLARYYFVAGRTLRVLLGLCRVATA
jgi:hypothetical protein